MSAYILTKISVILSFHWGMYKAIIYHSKFQSFKSFKIYLKSVLKTIKHEPTARITDYNNTTYNILQNTVNSNTIHKTKIKMKKEK